MELVEKALLLASEKIRTDLAGSEILCEQVLRVDPENISAKYLLAKCKQLNGMDEDYVRLMSEIAESEPESSEAQNGLGVSLLHLKRYRDAKRHFMKAVKADPNNSSAWTNLACCFRFSGDYDTAADILEMSGDETPEALTILAGCHMDNGLVDEAVDVLERSLANYPDHPGAKLDLACALRLKGVWETGELYMSRFSHYEKIMGSPSPYPAGKMWDGSEVGSKRVLLFCEQGLGDAINFCRFFFDFKERFPESHVRLDAPADLRRLLSGNGFEVSESKEGFDIYCSVMDLPHLLRMDEKDIRARHIRSLKKCDFSVFKGSFKVGVCWAGNPMNPRDEFRSMRLSEFRKVCGLEGVKLFSLQKEKRPRVWHSSDKVVDLSSDCEDMRLVDMSPHMSSWEDTAAIVDEMDLVISVDTSLLHLAASMGKKTWGLVSIPADWRWGMEGRDSVWYPTLRLFRQKERGNWASVMSEVRRELVKELQ